MSLLVPRNRSRAWSLHLLVLILLCLSGVPLAGAAAPTFTVGWSIYAGWNPYAYMAKSGILKRWADKYGVEIRVQRFDYAASLDAFVAKSIDACTMTNMEALDMPAAAGVDSTAIIVGDYSNGNDAVLLRNHLTLAQLPGKQVMLVQKTVSEYLFERAMVLNGLQGQLGKVRFVNTSDSDIVAAFMNNPSNLAVVTWKPLVSQIVQDKHVASVFDSSKIPGEILDLLVVQSSVLNRPDGSGQRFAKAITGAWYETVAQLTGTGDAANRALRGTAAVSDDTVDSYKEQLRTTYLFAKPQPAVAFTTDSAFKQRMELVRQFCFHHGLLGKNIQSVDDVAILYPDSTIQGNRQRVRLRFNTAYMAAAGEGKL